MEHVIVFCATGLIFLALARDRREEWAAAGKVIALAISIEIAQLLIYRMPFGFEWWDVREDTIGMILAMLLARSNYFQSAVKTLNS
jgi:VanZ family protein